MTGLCHGCFTSGVATSLADDGRPMCRTCRFGIPPGGPSGGSWE